MNHCLICPLRQKRGDGIVPSVCRQNGISKRDTRGASGEFNLPNISNKGEEPVVGRNPKSSRYGG
jgi:hypothetical protein